MTIHFKPCFHVGSPEKRSPKGHKTSNCCHLFPWRFLKELDSWITAASPQLPSTLLLKTLSSEGLAKATRIHKDRRTRRLCNQWNPWRGNGIWQRSGAAQTRSAEPCHSAKHILSLCAFPDPDVPVQRLSFGALEPTFTVMAGPLWTWIF